MNKKVFIIFFVILFLVKVLMEKLEPKMKNRIILYLLILFSIKSFGQQVDFISTEQKGKQIYIRYNLQGSESKYEIKLFFKESNSSSWSTALIHVSGDVGLDQTRGTNKLIIWDVLNEREKLVGDYVFGIEAVKERKKTKNDFSQLIISSYHGFPNTLKSTNIKLNPNYINELNPNDNNPIDEITSRFGTVGLRIQINPRGRGENNRDLSYSEWILTEDNEDLTDYLGYSLDLNYTSCNYTFSYIRWANNNNVQVMEVSTSVFRFLFNVHSHYSNSLKSDPYINIGIGGRIPTESYYSTNPNFTYQKGSFWTDESVGPTYYETFISLRFALGYNYYFSKNLGFMFELGMFGGGFIRTGVNIRFLK